MYHRVRQAKHCQQIGQIGCPILWAAQKTILAFQSPSDCRLENIYFTPNVLPCDKIMELFSKNPNKIVFFSPFCAILLCVRAYGSQPNSLSIQIRTVSNQRLLSALLNWMKPVYGPFGLSNMHRTLNFCPDQAVKSKIYPHWLRLK